MGEAELHRAGTELVTSEVFQLGNPDLPIFAHKQEIQDAIRQNPITIVTAPTGTGKTTQVPLYALEMTYPNGRRMFEDIVVTQPRILAARTTQERVAEEAAQTDAKIAYFTSREQTPGAKQHDQDIRFLTDGKASAQLLGSRPARRRNQLIIVDEIHERNPNVDVLLALLKEKTDPNHPHYQKGLKAVLMSATMDTALLRRYFGSQEPPVIEVKVPMYPVESYTVNDSIASVALMAAAESGAKTIAFLPGTGEIERLRRDVGDDVTFVPVHSRQMPEDQKKAFREFPHGGIIAGTPVLETSVTVPGAQVVADTGMVRTDFVRFDMLPIGSEGLYLEDATQDRIIQRRGRVGRTEPGWHYLCSPDGETSVIPLDRRAEYADPAILRTRLDKLLLQFSIAGRSINDIDFLQKPSDEAVRAARKRLIMVGAIGNDGRITERGKHINEIPLEVNYAAMLAFAEEQGYDDDVKRSLIDISAIMQQGGITKRGKKYTAWRELLDDGMEGVRETDSDLLAQLELYVEAQGLTSEELESFDLLEYPIKKVPDIRATLAQRLGVTLKSPEAIKGKHRAEVLTCIVAGNIAELWARNGDVLYWAHGSSDAYTPNPTTVTQNNARWVVGKLFTLGTLDTERHEVQDMTVVTKDMLLRAAKHLLSRHDRHDTIGYDSKTGLVMMQRDVRLGRLLVGAERIAAQVDANSSQAHKIVEQYVNDALRELKKSDPVTMTTLEEVESDLANPISRVCGTNPITGEQVLAWRGAQGWVASKEIAIISLEKMKQKILEEPLKQRRLELKQVAANLKHQVYVYKKHPQYGGQARELLAAFKADDKENWVDAAMALLEKIQA